jgi:hypothetical protein
MFSIREQGTTLGLGRGRGPWVGMSMTHLRQAQNGHIEARKGPYIY